MKSKFTLLVCLAFIIISIPCLAFLSLKDEKTQSFKEALIKSENNAQDEASTVKVFLNQSSDVVEMSSLEYLVGCVAAEMPAVYNVEALKAQAVVSNTYLKKVQRGTKDEALKGADISDSSKTHQGYINKEERQKRWGDNFEKYEEKITNAVKEVKDYIITYNGELITAAYHAISAGQTEDAVNVWGKSVPYLKSVESEFDKLSPDFSAELSINKDDFKNKLKDKESIDFSADAGQWINSEIDYSDTGTVMKIKIGGQDFSGQEIRNIFSLRSAVFSVSYKDGAFIFKTSGYGHLVGLSQYGADYMARQGSSWEEIIKHYYTGVEIEKE
ncbi:MAG: stage II sporulation protein D [Clostridiales bacterium]|nr:stage II sporulation protein D [Clostridiales bacterium]